MKKTYIKPETTVVALNVRNNMLVESNVGFGDEYDGEKKIEAREVIQQDIKSQDAWEEW